MALFIEITVTQIDAEWPITPLFFPFDLPFLVMSQETQTPVLAPAAASTPAPGTAPGTALPPLQRLCESESTATPGELNLMDVGQSGCYWENLDVCLPKIHKNPIDFLKNSMGTGKISEILGEYSSNEEKLKI